MRTRRYPIRRTTAPRRQRASDRARKVRRAKELWRILVRAKEPSGLCPVCGKRPWVEAMHIWAQGPHPSMRFEVDNGAPGCRACHRRIDSDHEAKMSFAVRYVGQARYDALRLQAIGRGKVNLDLVLIDLWARVEALKRRTS